MFFIIRYCDTGCCPRCESTRTGRYIYRPDSALPFATGIFSSEKWAMKHGMLTRSTSLPLNELGYNLFCESCGADYVGDYKVRYVTSSKLKEIMNEKEIQEKDIKDKYKRTKVKASRKDNKAITAMKDAVRII